MLPANVTRVTQLFPPKAGPGPKPPNPTPAAGAPCLEGWCAQVRSPRRDAAPGRAGGGRLLRSVLRVGAGSSRANGRAGGPKRPQQVRPGRPPAPPAAGPDLYLQRRLPSPGREAQARPPFPAGQAELAGCTDRRTDGRLGSPTEG